MRNLSAQTGLLTINGKIMFASNRYQYYNSTKPHPLAEPNPDVTYAERVLHESRLAQYEEKLAEWNGKLKLYSKVMLTERITQVKVFLTQKSS